MVLLHTGMMGSGKTLKAVQHILDCLSADKTVYTNITMNVEDENYHYYSETDFLAYFDFLKQTFIDYPNIDDAKSFIKSSKYHGAVFVIDEVQFLGFRTYDKVISDWLTIHRHFSQDIVMITPTATNVNKTYLTLVSRWYDFISPHNRVIKSHIQYKEYDGYGTVLIKTRIFKPHKELFSLYNTGKSESSTHPLVYKLGGLVVALLFVIYMLFFSNTSGVSKIISGKSFTGIPSVKSHDVNSSNSTVVPEENVTVPSYGITCYFTPTVVVGDYVWKEKVLNGYKVCRTNNTL